MKHSEAESRRQAEKSSLLAWSERQRLAHIDRLLHWRGWVNRRDLVEKFGISVPQASNDMVKYLTMNPRACTYNTRAKRYEATAQFRPAVVRPELEEDAAWLGLNTTEASATVVSTVADGRPADEKNLRLLVRAFYAGKAVKAHYFSVNSGREEDRWISPRAFAHNGLRWHCRAYCHLRGDFRDFVVRRITEITDERDDDKRELVDSEWLSFVTLHIRPHERLSPAARKALELDYRMEGGYLRWRVRKALEIYHRRKLGFPDTGTGVVNDTKQLFLETVTAG
jgi:predicted DNA-binding transcriptional regulator YafY